MTAAYLKLFFTSVKQFPLLPIPQADLKIMDLGRAEIRLADSTADYLLKRRSGHASACLPLLNRGAFLFVCIRLLLV